MADVNANIGVHIDTSAALVELKNLQRQLANFHSSVAKSSAASAAAQKNLQTNLLNSINATGKFSAQMGNVRTSTESFTHALETNKLSMREYFRYAGGSTRTFGRLFKQEFDTIGKVAQERVKTMQTQYIKMGRDASGAMRAMSIRPTTLNMNDYATKTALAAQKQALLNQLLKQGSTNLLNFGKNTQWAGRQLMVGFTVPLAYFGSMAAKTFMDLEKQAIRFKRVYGDMFTTTDETNKALADIQKLAEEFTKYGVAVVDTMEMAANAAAMGKTGADLTAQVAEATRLAVLGGVEQAQALETTISVTNAFGIAAEDLAKKVDFLNAVENQTVVSIEDLTIAIPKAGPVVKQLGGDVEDLAFFLTAMKEGGINASEGANALKSGLASLINPTEKASKMLAGFGVNINAIVESNQGNIRQTVIDFSRALDTLDPLNRARAIEQLFGKFQFSRLSTLFQNVTKDGTQASRVLNLAAASVEELAILSERELGVLEDAIGTDFKESIEKLKLAIAPIGKEFLKAITPVAKAIGEFLEKFNNLGDGTKKFIVIATTLVGVIGPVLLMTFGLLANGVANIIKLFITMRSGFLRAGANSNILAQQTSYLNTEQLEAASVAASLNQAHTKLTQSFTIETSAIKLLRQAYIDATIAATNFARANPGMMMPGRKGSTPKKFARGTTYVPGKGNKDNVPAVLMPGEAVIPTDIAQDPIFQPIIDAMINGNLQAFGNGATGVSIDGKEYNARSTRSAKSIRSFLDSLIKNPDGTLTHIDPKTKEPVTFTKKRLLEVLDGRYARVAENKFTLSEIKEKLSIGGVKKGSGISSSRGWIKTLTKKAGYPNMLAEQQVIEEEFKKKGLNPSQDQRKNLFQTQASHLTEEVGPDGKKIFRASNIAPDAGYVNNYLNTIKNNLGKKLLSMSDSDLAKALNINEKDVPKFRKELDGLVRGRHPKTAASANTLRAVAQYQIATNPNAAGIYQAHAAVAGIDYRIKNNFYKGGLKTLEQLFPNDKRVIANSAKKVAVKPGQNPKDVKTGRAVNPATTPLTKTDKAAIPSGQKLSHSRGLIVGRGRFIPPLGATAEFGYSANQRAPGMQMPPGMAMSKVEQDFKAQQNSLRRQIELVEKRRLKALKQELKTIEEKNKIATQSAPLTKAQLKEQKREVRAQRAQRVGRIAGPVAGIAGIGAMAGFATGNAGAGSAMMGVAALATIAPMLTNPLGILVAVLAAASAGFLLYTKMLKKAREEGMNLAKAMSMSAGKVKGLSVLSGQISASEIQARKRQTALDPLGEPQRKFGQNVLTSDTGKAMLSDVENLIKQNFSTQQIGEMLGTNLSQAVLQGAISTDQARSIASALGEKLGSYEIPLNVSAKITQLLGLNGENLKNNPLEVALAIKKDTMQNITESFKVFSAGKKNPLLEAFKIPEKPGGLFSVSSLPFGDTVKQFFNQKKENTKLDAAAVQLGFEAIGQNQQLLDSVNEQYDKKIKIAKTEKEISDLQAARKTNINKLNIENANTLTKIISLSKGLSDNAFNATVKESLDTRIKDAPTAVKLANEIASEKVLSVKDQTLRRTLQIGLASENGLTPESIISLTSFIGNSETASKSIDLFVKANGFAELETLTRVFGKFTGSKFGKDITPIQREFITKYINENDVELKDDLVALSALGNFKEQYNVTLDVNSNGVEDLKQATKAFGLIKNFPDKIDKKFLATVNDPEGNFKQFVNDFDILSQGKAEVSKYLYINYMLASNDPNLAKAAAAEKMSIPEYIAKGYSETLLKPFVIQQDPPDPKPRDTTLDDLLKKLKLTRDASVNAQGGIEELKRVFKNAKGDVTKFTGVIQQLNNQGADEGFIDFVSGLDNATQGTYLNVNKLKKGVVELTARGKEAMALYKEVELGAFRVSADSEIKDLEAQANGFERLTAAGVGVADSLELIANAEMMRSLAQAKTPQELDKLIAKFNKLKETQQKVLEDTDPERAFDIQMDKAMKYYDFLEKQERAAVKSEIDRIEKLIEVNDKLIEGMQRTIEENYDRPIEKFNQDLAIMDKAAQGINDKYDAQEKALEKISSINEEISQQEKGRLTLADALSQGDIAAAARAAQEIRAEAAQSAMEKSSEALKTAREAELAGLTVGGLTRTQIEEKIYNLEQARLPILASIRDLQDKNYNLSKKELEPITEALKIRIENIDTARTAWENQKLAIQKAGFEADKTSERFKIAESIVNTIKKLWEDIKDKNVTLTINTVNTTSGGGGGGGQGSKRAEEIKKATEEGLALMTEAEMVRAMNTGYLSLGGLVPKYFAKGGLSRGTDTVPAMLTPGEFVMRKSAVDKFGPMLSAINSPSFKIPQSSSYSGASSGMNSVVDNSSAMYNYNIGITVPQSNANPNDIANAVIGQIKYIDAQRIRGQR